MRASWSARGRSRHRQPLDRSDCEDDEDATIFEENGEQDHDNGERERIQGIDKSHEEALRPYNVSGDHAGGHTDEECDHGRGKADADRDSPTDKCAHEHVSTEVICPEPMLCARWLRAIGEICRLVVMRYAEWPDEADERDQAEEHTTDLRHPIAPEARPSVAPIERASPAGASRFCLVKLACAWVHPHLWDIDDEVKENSQDGVEEHCTHHERVVSVECRVHKKHSKARNEKDRFDDK